MRPFSEYVEIVAASTYHHYGASMAYHAPFCAAPNLLPLSANQTARYKPVVTAEPILAEAYVWVQLALGSLVAAVL